MIHKIPIGQAVVDGKTIPKGVTVLQLSGIYPVAPYFKNLQGVTITNEGPVSLLSSFKAENCKEWGLLGNRKDPFKISAPKKDASGIAIHSRSTDFEIAYLDLTDIHFAGIMAKDDGQKRGGEFVMRNIKIHHNRISKTGGEGLYIGATNPQGHDLESVEIYDNEITDTGWDGLQLGNCVKGAIIRDNRISRTGLNITRPQDHVQDNGIQVGERTNGNVYRNKIRDARGNGIICLGNGVHMYLNQIFTPGENGIYADDRADTLEGFKFTDNLIVNPKVYCIALHANKGLMNHATNNMLINPGGLWALRATKRNPFFEMDDNVMLKEFNNYQVDEASGFRNMPISEYLLNK